MQHSPALDRSGAPSCTGPPPRQGARLDSTNRNVQLSLARARAKAGRAEAARPIIDAAAERSPSDAEVPSLRWRIHLAVKDWRAALASGEQLVAADTSAATPDFFIRLAAAADALDSLPLAVALVGRGVEGFPRRRDPHLRPSIHPTRRAPPPGGG